MDYQTKYKKIIFNLVEIALKSDFNYKYASGIIKNKNLIKSSNNNTFHSETNVLRNINIKKNKKYTLIVVRVNSEKQFMISKPCMLCFKKILTCNFITKIIYINIENKFVKENVFNFETNHLSKKERSKYRKI